MATASPKPKELQISFKERGKLNTCLPEAAEPDTSREISLGIRWKILKDMGVPDHLTCLPEKLVCGSRSYS